ncbi:hypothetical protein M430DRAFT_26064 [Amorphotheca resinae ATCC 22711]|uniref:RNA polymerase I-specific transcription initiation factor RRN3 n=1 Tax=Amorphotheca resinae ATCC 22711 TaxID=857342 RepID=A0A2T3B8C1_AMORE|nr:hypothetical protein M430DRAFT_26064 [Amorphotheca resinae ATCC 22711]PSS23136.1 hypothetical protein M430DRAFT_26064 [Amorphotheca resinae ATCC 22711]
MVSVVPVVRTLEPAPSPKPSKPLLRRATRSGTIRKSDEADLDGDLFSVPSSPSKRARVTFNPTVEEKIMSPYSARGRSLEVIREEVRMAIEAHKKGDSADYDAMKQVFIPKKDGDGEDDKEEDDEDGEDGEDGEDREENEAIARAELKTYLLAVTSCVSLLKGCSSLVKAVLSCDWLGRDESFVKAYINFLGNLVSAQGAHLGRVLEMLVGHFHGVRFSSGRLPGYPDVSRNQLSSRVHVAVKHLLDIIPSAGTTLSQIINSKFPFEDESKKAHMTYINNLIYLLRYAPQLKSDVFSLITDRLVKIDVQMQVDLDDLDDDVAAAIVQAITMNASTRGDNDNGERSDDSDAESVASIDSLDEDAKRIKGVQDSVEKMDAILDLLFSIYDPYFLDPNSLEATEMFETLLGHFQKIILPTYRSRHTQFLLFHFAQRADYLVDQFAGTCAQLAFDTSRPAVIRQSSAAYLASFVARGIHVQPHVVRTVFDLIGSKLDNIRAENELTCRGPDLRRYSTFYAMTQALLYIFCFRWRDLLLPSDLFDEDDSAAFRAQDLHWIPSVKETLFRTIHSKLNPLKICSPPIVSEFAKIAKHLEFMQVYPLLETNKRIRLSQYTTGQGAGAIRDSGMGGSDDSWHQLDAYFPFDPYQLPVSKRWIEKDYVQWKGIPGLNQDDDDSGDEEIDETVDVDVDTDDTATDGEDDE